MCYLLLVWKCGLLMMWYSIGLCSFILGVVRLILVCRMCLLLVNLLVFMWCSRLRFFLIEWLW